MRDIKGWRTSVKARAFVFAVQTYFTERYHDTDPLQIFLTSGTPKGIQDFRRAQALANKKAGDREAVEYISMLNIRPIMESFDDDRSGYVFRSSLLLEGLYVNLHCRYVTIREVNNFSAAKPEYLR